MKYHPGIATLKGRFGHSERENYFRNLNETSISRFSQMRNQRTQLSWLHGFG